jgi:hypothetical protein
MAYKYAGGGGARGSSDPWRELLGIRLGRTEGDWAMPGVTFPDSRLRGNDRRGCSEEQSRIAGRLMVSLMSSFSSPKNGGQGAEAWFMKRDPPLDSSLRGNDVTESTHHGQALLRPYHPMGRAKGVDQGERDDGAAECCRGSGGVPQILFSSPRVGG